MAPRKGVTGIEDQNVVSGVTSARCILDAEFCVFKVNQNIPAYHIT